MSVVGPAPWDCRPTRQRVLDLFEQPVDARHRLKTFIAWSYERDGPDTDAWTNPHGLTYTARPLSKHSPPGTGIRI